MAQLQSRRKLGKKISQQPSLIPSTFVAQDQVVSEQQSFLMVQKTLQTSVSFSNPRRRAFYFRTDRANIQVAILAFLRYRIAFTSTPVEPKL